MCRYAPYVLAANRNTRKHQIRQLPNNPVASVRALRRRTIVILSGNTQPCTIIIIIITIITIRRPCVQGYACIVILLFICQNNNDAVAANAVVINFFLPFFFLLLPPPPTPSFHCAFCTVFAGVFVTQLIGCPALSDREPHTRCCHIFLCDRIRGYTNASCTSTCNVVFAGSRIGNETVRASLRYCNAPTLC